jgi:hypothetical protein
VVRQAAGRLADPSAQDLLTALDERLAWAGIATDATPPVRSYARHSLVDAALVRPDCLAAPRRAEAIERAIVQHRRVLLERFPSAARFPDSPAGELRVWPLQLIFHNVGWYLLVEEDHIGQPQGLLRSERLDRLRLRPEPADLRRSAAEHGSAVARLERLLHHCGGLYLGEDLAEQQAIASPSPQRRAAAMTTLRFSCAPWVFAFLREAPSRYPIAQVRFSRPLPADTWWHHPKAPHVLAPNDPTDSHPYPVELDLPRWTVAADVDLRSWLFGFGAGIRIEAPEQLREEHRRRAQEVLGLYGAGTAATTAATAARSQEERPVRVFPNRLRRD